MFNYILDDFFRPSKCVLVNLWKWNINCGFYTDIKMVGELWLID